MAPGVGSGWQIAPLGLDDASTGDWKRGATLRRNCDDDSSRRAKTPQPLEWWTAAQGTCGLFRNEAGDRKLTPAEDTIREAREERDREIGAAIGARPA